MARRTRIADAASSVLATLATLALIVGVLLTPNVVVANDTVVQPNCISPIQPASASTTQPQDTCFLAACTSPTCVGCFAQNGGCSNGCTAGTCVDAAGNQCGCGTPPGFTTCTCT